MRRNALIPNPRGGKDGRHKAVNSENTSIPDDTNQGIGSDNWDVFSGSAGPVTRIFLVE